MRRNLVLTVVLLALLCAGCPAPQTSQPRAGAAASTAPPEQPAKPGAPAPQIKQLVLIYTGDTLSALQPINNNDEAGKILRLGGLSALTAEIISYEHSITAMTRQRVEETGGDVGKVRADAQQGVLGVHPYLLLDYGGWERDGDSAGRGYVELQLRMYRDLKYAAVGMKLYERLTSAAWKSYAGLAVPPVLVNSAGERRREAPPAVPVITRVVHGALWGVAGIPLPAKDNPDPFAAMDGYVEAAAGELAQRGCKFRILLCSGGPKSLYEKLQHDKRFNVVIGVAPPSMAEPQGFGKIRPDGPVMLPELNWGGQEFAACHLIYPTDGEAPAEFNFERHVVQDDLQSPLPYRKQVAAAVSAHQPATGGKVPREPGAARIGGP
jgi:hypothetical protein